jgi:ribose 5-phosphate isomerase B
MGSDHVGYALKKELAERLEDSGFIVEDVGAFNASRSEYPIYGRLAAEKLAKGEADRAVLVCGTGFGIALAANTVSGVRCVSCTDSYTAYMSRLHNDANAIALGARVIGPELAKMLLDIWLSTDFDGGRHADRVDMLTEMASCPQPGAYKASVSL